MSNAMPRATAMPENTHGPTWAKSMRTASVESRIAVMAEPPPVGVRLSVGW
ncbi:hypothetical protein WBG99_32970 [Streptomyces sp. TG1A-60]|uniref:hypothetical protein n=1 Tax=Streptomyces sp. TG1A-60 TaxID=3129111 RepID=UPI0030D0E3F2